MNYYLVLCKCGHVTRDYYMPINFCIMAEDGEEAARIARKIPRVKHDYKDAILKVTKVNKEVFDYQNEINNLDPYLLCHSKHEQNEIFDLIKHRLVKDNHKERGDSSKYNDRKPNLTMQAKKYMYDIKLDYYLY